jgi:hypothetical protein
MVPQWHVARAAGLARSRVRSCWKTGLLQALLLELAYNKWATLRESISSPPSEKVFAHQRGL